MSSIVIQPASFSNVKTVKDVAYCINSYPKQDTNNEMAYRSSVEFVERYDAPVGTLSEFVEYDVFIIKCDDGILKVEKQMDEYIVVEKYELKDLLLFEKKIKEGLI